MFGAENIPALISRMPPEVMTMPWVIMGVVIYYILLIVSGSLIFNPDIIHAITTERSIKFGIFNIIVIAIASLLTTFNLGLLTKNTWVTLVPFLLASSILLDIVIKIISGINIEAGKTLYITISSILLVLVFFTPTKQFLELGEYEKISLMISLIVTEVILLSEKITAVLKQKTANIIAMMLN